MNTILLVLLLISLWTLFYQLFRQQGRVLLRLEQLLQQQGSVPDAPRSQATGLPVGSTFPAFTLPDLTGKPILSDEFRGKRTILVHWSPECGFCDMIASDLARIASSGADLRIVLVAHGGPEANSKSAEEHGLTFPILLIKESETLPAFSGFGTPVAYLLDAEGRVVEPVAVGSTEVVGLASAAARFPLGMEFDPTGKQLPGRRPLSESAIERHGLKTGAPAPAFRLPDVYGREVALDDYRGRRVMLVFSDPHCGPCEQLNPYLVRIDREHRGNNLQLIMVGRGDAEENRLKAEANGFQFPVVVQRKWEISREYGIFATPVAFLIDEEGRIAKNVATGMDEILNLAPKAEARA